MTPDEATTLQGIGHDVVRGFVAITNETLLLTIYGTLVMKAGFVLLNRDRRRTKAYLLTMLAILTMFIIAVVLWTLDLANFIMEAKVTLIQNLDEAIDSKLDKALAFIFRLAAAQDALYAYMAIATVMLTYCVGAIGSDIVLGNFEKPAFCRNVQMVTYVMPLVTTAAATSLIGLATWKYRHAIMTNKVTTSSGTKRSGRTQGEKVLVLLVESGLLYFIFFTIQVIEDVPQVHAWIESHDGLSFAIMMYSYCSSVIVGIYPTIVVVLAHSKHAVIDGATSGSRTASSSRIGRTNAGTDHASANWPTRSFQIGTKRGDEIELDAVLRGHTDEEEGRKRPAFGQGF
ncbi:hypothetical protein FB451DRAFT_1567994 [Mycena latifolia]|nr:hypothetical protein FB451DRAFT_1567994 [Mycena latifolia]